MDQEEPSGAQVLLELRAREAWNQRDYGQSRVLAEQAAKRAESTGECDRWWNMTLLQAECLRKDGLMQESVTVAQTLLDHPLTRKSAAVGARSYTLLALALQGCGNLRQAVIHATQATELAASVSDHIATQIEAEHALIAALAESDQLEDAWRSCMKLAELLQREVGAQTAGLGYWAIGNVAYLMHRVEDGTKYHRLAAASLSPTNDLDQWARFNRASAALRLAAGVVEPETLECIDRAEMASSIVGGSDRDMLELKLTRAHWFVLTGQTDTAIEQLRSICAKSLILATHTAAEAHFLLGQALKDRQSDLEAVLNFEASEQLFLQAGAEDRAGSARELITEIQQPAP